MKTNYTHTGTIIGVVERTKGKNYKALLRKVGKWWETKNCRRFDAVGNEKGYNEYPSHPGWWRLKIDTIEKLNS